MSSLNMKPGGLIMLAVLGVGVYWYFSRRTAMAVTPAQINTRLQGGNTANRPTSPNVTKGILAGLDTWINGQASKINIPASVDGIPVNPTTAYLSDSSDNINGLF